MNLKRIFCVGLMLLACTACAEEQKYISPADDLYWHVNASCGTGMPMMEIDDTRGYFECPVCIQENIEKGVAAVERGGTIILRMTDAWMAAREDTQNIFAAPGGSTYRGEEAYLKLAEQLHGDAYSAFLNTYAQTGKAEARTCFPDIYPSNSEIFMNQRHIGGAWYTVMRPEAVSGNSIEIYLRFFAGDIRMENDTLRESIYDEWGERDYKLKFSDRSGQGSAFFRDCGEFTLTLYREMDIYIAVIHQKDGEEEYLKKMYLTIGDQPDIGLEGYMHNEQAVFCCVLTDGEAHLVQNDGDIKLWHEDPAAPKIAYSEAGYAIAQQDREHGWGIVDRAGNFVVGPGYTIARAGKDVAFLWERTLDMTAINLNTLEVIGRYKRGYGEYISIFSQNDHMYILKMGEKLYFYEMATGTHIATLDLAEVDSISGQYYGYTEGVPQRLVFRKGDEYWLADLAGARITESYEYIEALNWNGDKGVFVVQKNGEFIHDRVDAEKYLYGCDERDRYGDDWRAGLIDQDGNVLAEMEYVFIKALSETEIELRDQDGEVICLTLP